MLIYFSKQHAWLHVLIRFGIQAIFRLEKKSVEAERLIFFAFVVYSQACIHRLVESYVSLIG